MRRSSQLIMPCYKNNSSYKIQNYYWRWLRKLGPKWLCLSLASKVWYKTAVLTKSEFQRRFPDFDFNLLFYKDLSQDGYIINLNNDIQKYNILSSFPKHFEIMVPATLGKTLGPPMPKLSNDSNLQENPEPCTTCTLSRTCLIDVVKSNLFYHLIEITYFQKHIDGLLTDM